ncbi:MAG: type II toxin-antitoxin system RelE/ParE family toxin [Actinobacteria bacterium]|nr:MAG: type II toxin-antitoxin system RelE/ParE family toxin [Actinomycetota bacterium]
MKRVSTSDRYSLRLDPSARRGVARLPSRHLLAIAEFIEHAVLVNPWRVGKPLAGDLDGYLSARIDSYRIVYRIEESAREVHVTRVEHRSNVYRSR